MYEKEETRSKSEAAKRHAINGSYKRSTKSKKPNPMKDTIIKTLEDAGKKETEELFQSNLSGGYIAGKIDGMAFMNVIAKQAITTAYNSRQSEIDAAREEGRREMYSYVIQKVESVLGQGSKHLLESNIPMSN